MGEQWHYGPRGGCVGADIRGHGQPVLEDFGFIPGSCGVPTSNKEIGVGEPARIARGPWYVWGTSEQLKYYISGFPRGLGCLRKGSFKVPCGSGTSASLTPRWRPSALSALQLRGIVGPGGWVGPYSSGTQSLQRCMGRGCFFALRQFPRLTGEGFTMKLFCCITALESCLWSFLEGHTDP